MIVVDVVEVFDEYTRITFVDDVDDVVGDDYTNAKGNKKENKKTPIQKVRWRHAQTTTSGM
jgi:hypothetical protein